MIGCDAAPKTGGRPYPMPEEPNIDLSAVERIVASCGRGPEAALPILQALQEEYAYLPEAALRRVVELTAISAAELAGVATFYAQFRHRPAGRHIIKVCDGTACHVKGAETLLAAFRRHLNIPPDADTDADRLFTVQTVACLGCCMLAPAVQIGELVYGHVRPENVGRVLRDFLRAQAAAGPSGGAAGGGAAAGEVRLCLCSSCAAAGAAAVFEELRRCAAALRLPVTVREAACTGISYQAPLADVALSDGRLFRYGRLAPADAEPLLLRHFRPPRAAARLRAAADRLLARLIGDAADEEPLTRYSLTPRQDPDALYTAPQLRLALEHAGELAPLALEDYLARGGFAALRQALAEARPERIIEQLEASGLRGRGGAGYPTGQKWRAVREAPDAEKYVICNGDEGDPGAFMDRMILESFPFRVLEGLALAAYAVGARRGYLYIRAEYPLAVRRVEQALAAMRQAGWLGAGIQGSDFSLELSVARGAGAFVCGEETALIAALEGRRGMPRYRPPYPAQSGLRGRPTLVNNVETLALVPWILRHGPAAFAAIGTPRSRGTKTFALAGKIRRGGLIEVPMGIPLREIVETIGGGTEDGRPWKAVQIGGPSGGCVPAALGETPVDYEALTEAGAMMGSGGLVVLDAADCMVDVARYFLSFTQAESCGKCTYCRVGTRRMLELLERLCAGRAVRQDLERLEHLAEVVREGSLCGLGRTAPNIVRTTLRYFRDEYEAHLQQRCPAGKCKALIRYTITDKCIGCTRCAQRCPVDAIAPRPYQRHEIDAAKCTRCDTCRRVCPADAVEIVSAAPAVGGG